MTKSKYRNGSLWKLNYPEFYVAVLQVLPDCKWCLISLNRDIGEVISEFDMITDPSGNGKWKYKYQELPERLKDWKLMDNFELRLCLK